MTAFAAMCGGVMIESVRQRSAFRRMGDGLIARARNVLQYAGSSPLHTVEKVSTLTTDD